MANLITRRIFKTKVNLAKVVVDIQTGKVSVEEASKEIISTKELSEEQIKKAVNGETIVSTETESGIYAMELEEFYKASKKVEKKEEEKEE